jgi:hypothetical protein
MNVERDIWVGTRAYALWEENGRLEGEDRQHWLQAVQEYELMMRTLASADGREIMADRKRGETE